ncbi:MAG: cutinase family protein [Mycobacteriaceae bacterium]|uniref:cutinase family protein n=1 Tax=Corynebacterium sp. TaxID=1720 RepID=UPI003F9A97C0
MRKFLTIAAALVLAVVLVLGVGTWMSRDSDDSAGPGPGPGPGPTGTDQPDQPESCPAYALFSAPGTWESTADDDPIHPSSRPHSLLLNVTQPLQEEFGDGVDGGQLESWTLPYSAEFRNVGALQEKSYDDSRNEGYSKLEAEMVSTNEACPQTRMIIVGFSQGAVLSGDLATAIGNGDSAVPADALAGVALVADGRREDGKGELIGSPEVEGIGAEIALSSVEPLVQPIVPGASMRGPRPQDFGELQDRTLQFCAPADLVCSAPRDVGNAIQRAHDLIDANRIHAQYSSNGGVVDGGGTVPEWITGWVRDIVNEGR